MTNLPVVARETQILMGPACVGECVLPLRTTRIRPAWASSKSSAIACPTTLPGSRNACGSHIPAMVVECTNRVHRRDRFRCLAARLPVEAEPTKRRERVDALVGDATTRHIEDDIHALATVRFANRRRHVIGA